MRLLVAAVVLGAITAPVWAEPPKRDIVLRSKCIGDRCALYERGRRVGSITDDGTGRYVIRDKRGRITAKVLPDVRGVRIKPKG